MRTEIELLELLRAAVKEIGLEDAWSLCLLADRMRDSNYKEYSIDTAYKITNEEWTILIQVLEREAPVRVRKTIDLNGFWWPIEKCRPRIQHLTRIINRLKKQAYEKSCSTTGVIKK